MKLYTNELRYGSWIDYLGQHIQCDINTIYAYSKVVGETEMYKPIELTTDILLKCKFEDKGDYLWTNYTNYNTLFVIAQVNGEQFKYWVTYGTLGVKIESLHKLQNLYLAITGTELNYTP